MITILLVLYAASCLVALGYLTQAHTMDAPAALVVSILWPLVLLIVLGERLHEAQFGGESWGD